MKKIEAIIQPSRFDLPGLAGRIETAAGIGAVLVEDPLRCVVRGAAEMLERKKDKTRPGPGLRQLTSRRPPAPSSAIREPAAIREAAGR